MSDTPTSEEADSPWLTDQQQRVWRQYLNLTRLLKIRIEADLNRTGGIPEAYYLILSTLSESPTRSRRMNDLAVLLNASQSRTSHAVARLEDRGWVRRERSPEDGRGQVCCLTPLGWDIITELAPSHARTVRDALFEPLDADDLVALERAFSKILPNITS